MRRAVICDGCGLRFDGDAIPAHETRATELSQHKPVKVEGEQECITFHQKAREEAARLKAEADEKARRQQELLAIVEASVIARFIADPDVQNMLSAFPRKHDRVRGDANIRSFLEERFDRALGPNAYEEKLPYRYSNGDLSDEEHYERLLEQAMEAALRQIRGDRRGAGQA